MDLFTQISFKTSKLVTTTYSTSFSVAVSVLPRRMRDAIYSIYGFVRFADEIVDSFHDSDQATLLANFERDYRESLLHGISVNPVLHSFTHTKNKYGISDDLVEAFLDSMKADLSKKEYFDANELNQYIYGSADVVGLMCLRVFVNGDDGLYNELKVPALRLGSAFQKVNFLRDLRADMEVLERKYFPQLNGNEFDDRIKREIIDNIESDFKIALEGLRKLPGKSKLAVLIAYTYYSALLSKLKRTPAEKIATARIRVSDAKKLLLFVKSNVQYHVNMV